ncbi:MAG: DUF3810 family protein [Acidobacteria bacterium]|nr:DUF3810 family protein [Acidobacteriota bacterium]
MSHRLVHAQARVRGWWGLPVLAVAVFVMPWPGLMVEQWYSRGLFPRMQALVTSVSNLTPFAWMDVGLVLVAVFLTTVVVRMVRPRDGRGRLGGLWDGVRRVVRLAAILALVFLLLWGLNYRRVPLETTLGGSVTSPEAVRTLAQQAARQANVLRDAAAGRDAGYSTIAERLVPSFQDALSRLSLPPLAVPGRPKVSHVLTPFFTAAGVTGMLNPVALESIVHPELLPFERPMVLAHEWAHLAGLADEADASALAWLACVTGDAGLAYSAHLFVVLETASAMPRAEWVAIRETLSPGVREDIAARAARLMRQRPGVRAQAFRVYDGYLRSNRVEDGVRSYSRVLRVLLTPGMQRAVAGS